MNPDERKALRKAGISARESLSDEERANASQAIVSKIAESEEFKAAKLVMIYRGIGGEVRLEGLPGRPEACGKKFAYPLCVSKTEMIALVPEKEDSWKKGAFGIMEPVREKSEEVRPEDIDLVICPCTVFDEKCGRMGMGAGYYDRYLAKCTGAKIAAAAFEVQKTDKVPMESWDRKMDIIFTEKNIF